VRLCTAPSAALGKLPMQPAQHLKARIGRPWQQPSHTPQRIKIRLEIKGKLAFRVPGSEPRHGGYGFAVQDAVVMLGGLRCEALEATKK
jgi:hypothetical protein